MAFLRFDFLIQFNRQAFKIRIEIGGSKAALCWDSEDSNALWMGRRDGYKFILV